MNGMRVTLLRARAPFAFDRATSDHHPISTAKPPNAKPPKRRPQLVGGWVCLATKADISAATRSGSSSCGTWPEGSSTSDAPKNRRGGRGVEKRRGGRGEGG
eukprot:scaffold18513_cov101-Isochrysis_galbana.AAC.1